MIKFLTNVFSEYGFESVGFSVEKKKAVLFKSNSGFSNYVVIESASLDEFLNREFYDCVYSSVSELVPWDNQQLKNTTLILVHLNDDVLGEENDDDDLKSRYNVIDKYQLVEENKYIFKKHIFSYTTYELNSLITEFESLIDQDFTGFVKNQVLNSIKFSEFKNQKEYLGWYGLLLKILIKLPFIKISSKGDFYYDVTSEIQDGIEEENLQRYQSFIDGVSTEDSINKCLQRLEDFYKNETN
ncbi:hypothetical protein [Halobacteriovorax sp. YZS-1-1]|uniref:hypothetical protein n=1 Tax=unclassified Halobacteriovorax TaxID=2639665 RepID=UPI00399BE88F